MPSMLDHALALAAQGFRVFPLTPGGKEPAFSTDWKRIATTDTERIRAMWWDPVMEVDQPYNVGIATGHGLVVLDVDNKNGKSGGAALAVLELMHGDLPETYTVETPNGGQHYYFRTDERIGNSVNKVRDGLDIRGDGGFVVAEGSRIGDRTYARRGSHSARADLPAAWKSDILPGVEGGRGSRLRTHGADRTRPGGGDAREVGLRIEVDPDVARAQALAYLEAAPVAVEGDGGNDTTYRVAARVKDFGVATPLEALEVMGEWNDNCAPPWQADDLLRIIESAYKHGQNPIGVDARAPAEAEFEPVEVVDRRTTAAALPVRNILAEGWNPYQHYLIKGLVNFGMVGFVAGSKNAGKSPLLLDIAAHVVKGEEWLGHRVKQAYVLYVATEGWTGIGNRLRAVRQVYFDGAESVALDYVATGLDLRTSRAGARAIAETAKARAAMFGLPPGLIIIDTFSHTLAGGDDSNQADVKPAVANMKWLAGETGAAVLAAHHPTKNGSSGVRGSSTIEDDTDLTIRVEQDPKSTRRWVSTPRVKDYAEIQKVAFDIRTVELGEDQDGDKITSVVVSWRPDAEDEFSTKMTGTAEKALESLRVAIEAGGRGNATIAEWLKAHTMSQKGVKAGCISDAPSVPKTETLESQVKRGRKELMHLGVVLKDEEDQYSIGRGVH